jgi:agmatinase
MSTDANESRLNLPCTGSTLFCKLPICTDLDALDADVASIGAPSDLGTQYRSGTRIGPRASSWTFWARFFTNEM